jgi:phospholipid/cholesterol/gamma-HCH transport system permease protein
MQSMRSWPTVLETLGRGAGRAGARWSASWWQVLQVGAAVFVLSVSPSSYERGHRLAMARHIVAGTLPLLPGFALLSALVSLVLTRIVIVTAVSYGLSHYALEMVVRVLVLELIPLGAALYVALRGTLPSAGALAALRAGGRFEALHGAGIDPIRRELLPRVVAGAFAVLMLAAISCLIAMLIAYPSVYGFRVSAFGGFTRTLGRIFDPGVAMVFALKTLFFALAVALIPVATALRAGAGELQSLLRLVSVVVLIEIGALMVNYR